jgi:hypothetical protein
MFYHISLNHEIMLHPRYFGPQLMDTVKQKLFTEVEGTCTGMSHGTIFCKQCLWIRIMLMPIRIQLSMLMHIQIRIRILPLALHRIVYKEENLDFH